MHEHKYSITTCPHCGNDLTKESGVTIEGSQEGFNNALVPSELEKDGTLLDAFDIIENGLHSDTLCGQCGESLSEYEK